MKASTGATTAILALLALTGAPCLVSTGEEIPQPSPANNTLYLHSTGKSTWMNAGINQTTSEITAGGNGIRSFSFLLDPALDRTAFLVINRSSEWLACVHATCNYPFGGNGRLHGLNATVILDKFKFHPEVIEIVDDNYTFRFTIDMDIIKPGREFNFTFRHQGSDMGPPPFVTIFTDGSSYLKIPVAGIDTDTDNDSFPNSIDPDDDNDGWNDTADAYPLDLDRWKKPMPARGFLPGFDALPAVVALGIMILALIRRQRPRRLLR